MKVVLGLRGIIAADQSVVIYKLKFIREVYKVMGAVAGHLIVRCEHVYKYIQLDFHKI